MYGHAIEIGGIDRGKAFDGELRRSELDEYLVAAPQLPFNGGFRSSNDHFLIGIGKHFDFEFKKTSKYIQRIPGRRGDVGLKYLFAFGIEEPENLLVRLRTCAALDSLNRFQDGGTLDFVGDFINER
jgi:hypothetical protein